MKKLTKTLWILPIIAGAVIVKGLISKKQNHTSEGSKGGRAIKTKFSEPDVESTLNKYHINDV